MTEWATILPPRKTLLMSGLCGKPATCDAWHGQTHAWVLQTRRAGLGGLRQTADGGEVSYGASRKISMRFSYLDEILRLWRTRCGVPV